MVLPIVNFGPPGRMFLASGLMNHRDHSRKTSMMCPTRVVPRAWPIRRAVTANASHSEVLMEFRDWVSFAS